MNTAVQIANQSNTKTIVTTKSELDFMCQEAINNIYRRFVENDVIQLNSSFGKDSSVLVALTIEAAKRFFLATGTSPKIRIVTSNTRVENPLLIRVIHSLSNEAISYAKSIVVDGKSLDIEQYWAEPIMLERALVTTIGGRTIFSASGMASKCQGELKGNPLNKARSRIRKEFKGSRIVNFTGVRFAESSVREKNMKERGESASEPVENPKSANDLFMAPIANWEDKHVFDFMDRAAADDLPFETFSNLISLISLYEMTGLEVCSASSGGDLSESSCGGNPGRMGCFTCQKVGDDHSMRSALLVHSHLEPLYDFNRLIRSGMKVPHHRAWLGRDIKDDGTALVSGVSHSKDWCQTLYKAALTIQANEIDWANENNKPMRFEPLITQEEAIAVAYQWTRYFGIPWSEAINIWNEIHGNPAARMSKEDIEKIIEENKAAEQPLKYFAKARGRFQMVSPDMPKRYKDMGLIDAAGEMAGVYASGSSYVDKHGRMHSPLANEISFTVDLGDEPELAWFWISEIASEGNADVAFLTRNEYLAFRNGYQTGMAKSLEYAHLLRELDLVDRAHDIEYLQGREEFIGESTVKDKPKTNAVEHFEPEVDLDELIEIEIAEEVAEIESDLRTKESTLSELDADKEGMVDESSTFEEQLAFDFG